MGMIELSWNYTNKKEAKYMAMIEMSQKQQNEISKGYENDWIVCKTELYEIHRKMVMNELSQKNI